MQVTCFIITVCVLIVIVAFSASWKLFNLQKACGVIDRYIYIFFFFRVIGILSDTQTETLLTTT